MTLFCAAGCGTRLGRVVVTYDGWATFFFNEVPRVWDATRRGFICEPCARVPEEAEAA